jgi:DNA-3-methyladenine glycosylase I
MTANKGPDGLHRCTWPGLETPEYTRYHDTEWGVPVGCDRKLFEKLILEGFQSGLSWLTILRKRDTFRQAFDDFDATKIARYDQKYIERLLGDPGIIRNRLKIEATIDNARAFLALQQKQRLGPFLWQFVDGKPIINRYKSHGDVPPQTDLSTRLSKALKSEGFRFVGPTTVYAFLQSMGFVNDHLTGCHRHAACAAMQKTWQAPH